MLDRSARNSFRQKIAPSRRWKALDIELVMGKTNMIVTAIHVRSVEVCGAKWWYSSTDEIEPHIANTASGTKSSSTS